MRWIIVPLLCLAASVQAAGAEMVCRPTFVSCSIDAGIPAQRKLTVKYRRAGGEWRTDTDFHGNLTGLDEDTGYEVKVLDGKKLVGKGSFRTWSDKVPVGRTVELDPDHFKAPYVISEKGSPDAWVRYVVKGGILENKDTGKPTFIIKDAEYVVIDDAVIKCAAESRRGIVIKDSRFVRLRGCDISGWGRHGVQNFSFLPKKDRYGAGNGSYVAADGTPINNDCGIEIGRGNVGVVVERCYFHDPVGTSCSWYYHHPEGPVGIRMCCPDHSTVIRWCDFVGSDFHRWNDAVEGMENFKEDGGFNSDADVYGNFMVFANDDCIELDGGQRNIRCFGNRFEGALCGVSVQGCMVGPSFVYDNLFSGLEDEFSHYGQTVKTGGGLHGVNSSTYIYGNTFWGGGYGIMERPNLRSVITDNVFCGSQKIESGSAGKEPLEAGVRSSSSIRERNRFGIVMDESSLDTAYPQRPLPFTLSRARISVGRSREPVVVKIDGRMPEGSVLMKPEGCDWFDARIDGDRLVITFDDGRMHGRREYRGAVILRTPDGLSRPLTLYATTDFVPPVKADRPGDYAQYLPLSLKPGAQGEVSFEVPSDGRYWIMIHGCITVPVSKRWPNREWPSLKAAVDDAELQGTVLQMYDYPTWVMLNPGGSIYSYVKHFDLAAGQHRVKLAAGEGNFYFDGLVLTDNPASFEPNRELF